MFYQSSHLIYVQWCNLTVVVLQPLTWMICTVVSSTGITVWNAWWNWMHQISLFKMKNGCYKKLLMHWLITVVVVVQLQVQVIVHLNPSATCWKGNKDVSVKTCSVNVSTTLVVRLSSLVQHLKCTNVVCHVKWRLNSSNHLLWAKSWNVTWHRISVLRNVKLNVKIQMFGMSLKMWLKNIQFFLTAHLPFTVLVSKPLNQFLSTVVRFVFTHLCVKPTMPISMGTKWRFTCHFLKKPKQKRVSWC